MSYFHIVEVNTCSIDYSNGARITLYGYWIACCTLIGGKRLFEKEKGQQSSQKKLACTE